MTLKIADFGMSKRMLGNRPLTDRCVTTWYRPPEIMLGDVNYGKAVDIWGIGCILCEMVHLEATFRCTTELEGMLTIFRALGTPTEAMWPGVSALPYFNLAFPSWPPRSAALLLVDHALEGVAVCPAAADLVAAMLKLCPAERISALEALTEHPYLSSSHGSSSPAVRRCDEQNIPECCAAAATGA